LGISENRVLRRIFGHKRNRVKEGCRRLHNEELHNLYASQNIIRMIKSRRMRWTEHAACMGGVRNAYKISARRSEMKRPLRRPAHR
jgi:hypothetical protein